MTVRSGVGGYNVLPSRYSQTPLRDITSIARRVEADATESHIQFENEINITTPILTMAAKNVDIVMESKSKDSDFIIPPKKLMNSIDKVRRIWMEEQQRLQRTSTAKMADRARKEH
ncbi:hypothetical protein RND81_12G081100 [Saponaria officinalis]|uniref:Uncharacterized protein n=1 Tax=Saponaria officinalis TaxID=3572 RepID=A0AAW1H7Y0_SAPOF